MRRRKRSESGACLARFPVSALLPRSPCLFPLHAPEAAALAGLASLLLLAAAAFTPRARARGAAGFG